MNVPVQHWVIILAIDALLWILIVMGFHVVRGICDGVVAQ